MDSSIFIRLLHKQSVHY